MKRAKFITTNANGILLFDRFQFQTAFCSIKNSAKVSSLVRHSSSLSLLPRGESKAYISCQIIVRLRQRLKFWLKFQSAAVDACECNCAKQTILQMKFKIANIISSRQTRKRRWKISIYYEFLSKSWKFGRGKNAIILNETVLHVWSHFDKRVRKMGSGGGYKGGKTSSFGVKRQKIFLVLLWCFFHKKRTRRRFISGKNRCIMWLLNFLIYSRQNVLEIQNEQHNLCRTIGRNFQVNLFGSEERIYFVVSRLNLNAT